MVQNLVLVYAQLVHSQLEGVLTFLAGVPGPSGQSALHFVLTQWCSKQHLFFGAYEEKVMICDVVVMSCIIHQFFYLFIYFFYYSY